MDKKPSRAVKTIAIANRKGGVGKSTVTILLAEAYRKYGMSVEIDDRDEQATATTAARLLGIPLVGESDKPDVRIIDTAPSLDHKGTLAAYKNADRIVVVLTPSPNDIASTGQTLQALSGLRGDFHKVAILWNMVENGQNLSERQGDLIDGFPVEPIKACLRRLARYKLVSSSGWAALDRRSMDEVTEVALKILTI